MFVLLMNRPDAQTRIGVRINVRRSLEDANSLDYPLCCDLDPAHDLQAMDRAYRFGQTRDVSVYRLLGAGSLEELIYARQLYKQQQMAVGYNASLQTRYFEGVQGDKDKQGELFGIRNIFKLHEGSATKLAVRHSFLGSSARHR